MAKYSNTKKPAFFIPIFDYLQSIGQIKYQNHNWNDVHLLNPTKTHTINASEGFPDFFNWGTSQIGYTIELEDYYTYSGIADENGFVYLFILGHNFRTRNCSIEIEMRDLYDNDIWYSPIITEEIINYNSSFARPDYNGFSIVKLKYNTDIVADAFKIRIRGFSDAVNDIVKLGCVSLCSKWNPPHSPDLSLEMKREYDGVKNIKTKGGATLSNASYTRGGTYWANNYAWELSGSDYSANHPDRTKQRTLGRRNWSMNFSYLSPSDLMPEIESLDYYQTEFIDNDNKSIVESQSFFARVLNRVQGSHLPFIFLPNDSDPNYNPDQWAICRFDQKDFPIKQKAPELYNLRLKLRESY